MNSRMTWLIMLLVLLNLLDLITTNYAMALGAIEANPLMARGLERGHAGLYKALGLAAAIGLTVRRLRLDPNMTRTYTYVYVIFCLLYTLVVLNNTAVIYYMRTLNYQP